MYRPVSAILLFILCGCTYTSNPNRLTSSQVLDFHTQTALNIINTQSNESGEIGGLPVSVNLKEATQKALSILSEELTNHGVVIDAHADKKLFLSLESLVFRTDTRPAMCQATFLLKPGENATRRISGSGDYEKLGWKNVCDNAITDAIGNIVNDPNIRHFIDQNLPNLPVAQPQDNDNEPLIVRIPKKTFILPDALLPSEELTYNIRFAEPADMEAVKNMQRESMTMLGLSMGISAVSVAEAVAIPGFFSGSLIAGAIFIVPMAITLTTIQHNQLKTVETELKQNDLAKLIRDNMLLRTNAARTETDNGDLFAEMLITSYGLSESPLCLFANAAIFVKHRGKIIYEDSIFLEPYLRSDDAPAPACSSLDTFAKNEGELLRKSTQDYAQTFAAILIKRTRGLPW